MEESSKIYKEYLKFVKERIENTNFHAQEKLQAIEDMSEIILHARKNYKESKEK